MTNLDVICIGAINYDYMFHCKEEDLNVKEELEGDEKLSNPISEIENDVQELVKKDRAYTTQVGGSAFITLKVVKYIFSHYLYILAIFIAYFMFLYKVAKIR